jgi:hypothetical protein
MEFNMKYPMIITLSNISDCFLITYINNILCENLGYSKKKIIGSDFHDLIPFQIKNEHNLIMKQFLFLNNPYLSKKSYILDYEKYLTQCDFECRVLPDFKNSFHIIINSDFNVLIPFQIREEHNLVMKQFLFLSNPLFSKKSYILDFEKYLTQCHFECRLLPDLKNSFHIIINFKLLVNEEEETITYSVFLDKDFNFISLCHDFEQLFFF